MFNIARISPSILASDYNNKETVKTILKTLEDAKVSMVHLDVMDGVFVKNKTFDHTMVEFCKENSSLLLDVHLMIDKPENHISKYIKAGADILTVHYESTDKLEEILKEIRSQNTLAGVSIRPKTPVSVLEPYIKKNLIDVVLIMSVEPGAYGQTFIPGSGEKVAALRELSKDLTIEVDGGVNLSNSKMLRKMGANILVSGATVFGSENLKKTIRQLSGRCFFGGCKLFQKKHRK